jgi:formyltetrahydrofolate deformylase
MNDTQANIILRLKDEFSKNLQTAGRDFESFARSVDQVGSAMSRTGMKMVAQSALNRFRSPEDLRLLPAAAQVRVTREERRPIVVCATREPHCLGELLLLDAVGDLPGRIVGVVSNHDVLRPLVERFGVPFTHVPHDGVSRAAHEAAVAAAIDAHAPEYVVLARYMRVLSEKFIERRPNGIVNIHHSFLPAFAGASPYRQAFGRGVKLIGATAHFVTAELDDGPIIAQSITPVDHQYGVVEMVQAGRDIEKTVLARALKLVFEDRVFLSGRRTIIFQ